MLQKFGISLLRGPAPIEQSMHIYLRKGIGLFHLKQKVTLKFDPQIICLF